VGKTVRLTARDRAIFRTIFRQRVASASQIARLHFPSSTKHRRRLRRLARAGYLLARPDRQPTPRDPVSYRLTRRAARAIAPSRLRPLMVRRADLDRGLTDGWMRRRLGVVDVVLGFSAGMRRRRGGARWWFTEAFATHRPAVASVPDVLLELSCEGNRQRLWLLVDDGTRSRLGWRRTLHRLGPFIRARGSHPLLVLCLAGGEDQMLGLLLRSRPAVHVGGYRDVIGDPFAARWRPPLVLTEHGKALRNAGPAPGPDVGHFPQGPSGAASPCPPFVLGSGSRRRLRRFFADSHSLDLLPKTEARGLDHERRAGREGEGRSVEGETMC